MTDKELKELKDRLWHSADILRASAHLSANKYGQPILGLIFLRYADILFKQHLDEINTEYEKLKGSRRAKSRKDIAIEKCGFYLPEKAFYDYINDAPDDANKAQIVKQAMEAIEINNPKMSGVLPKEVYAGLVPEEEPELLSKIIRIFKDIPENCTIDIFGEIYEYFLGNFALAEGKDGGTFYTPPTVIRYMVEVLDPQPGDKKFLDPACGSGGMFVQAARYMHKHNATESEQMKFRCYGVEKEPDTVKLAKMNLLLNNIRGDIVEANSFYSDPYSAFGAFDYVMANPPFNVDEVAVAKVVEDIRFSTYGVPRNKSKSAKKVSDKKETVPNANYLWIGYFATAMNKNGKAALVMANSASDASGSEYEIRKKMIEEGIISQMVTLPSNMFSSVTLPATLWFFDKQKPNTDKKDEILFIDARNIFTQVDRSHRKFSDEQIKNLGIITKLYEGKTEEYQALLNNYKAEILRRSDDLSKGISALQCYSFYFDGDGKKTYKKPKLCSCAPKIIEINSELLSELNYTDIASFKEMVEEQDKEVEAAGLSLHFEEYYSKGQTEKIAKYDTITEKCRLLAKELIYYSDNLLWLMERFPDGRYQDIIGLCKAAKLDGEDGIIDQDYSLNAGRYVGVVIEDDGMTQEEFKQEMISLNSEFAALSAEAKVLEELIANNLKGLLGE